MLALVGCVAGSIETEDKPVPVAQTDDSHDSGADDDNFAGDVGDAGTDADPIPNTGGDDGLPEGIPEPAGFPYVLHDGSSGVTYTWFNRGAFILWRNPGGDWLDANDVEQGEVPFARKTIADQNGNQVVEIDLTSALATHDYCRFVSEGLLLKVSGGYVKFHAREAVDPTQRPRLVVVDAGGGERELPAVADSALNGTTTSATGTGSVLSLRPSHGALAFGACEAGAAPPRSLRLRMTTSDQTGSVELAVYLLNIPTAIGIDAPVGFSYDYADNVALRADPRVWMATDFDTLPACLVDDCAPPKEVCSGFTRCSQHEALSFATAESEPAVNGFVPRSGQRALRVDANADQSPGALYYRFTHEVVAAGEQESARFRYWVFLVDEPSPEAWNPVSDSGKFPGFDGPRVTPQNTVKCGNGGIVANGTCWSARGHYEATIPAENPFTRYTTLAHYVYHPDWDVPGTGQTWAWNRTNKGQIKRGEWHCVEQHLQMNTPGLHDGRLQVWINEELVMDRQDIKLRGEPPYDPEIITETAGIVSAWFTFQFGGRLTRPEKPITLYIDDVVVARGDLDGGSHIGCK